MLVMTRRTNANDRLVTLCVLALLVVSMRVHAQTDPFPSWHDGIAERAIVSFVQRTTQNKVCAAIR